MNYIFDFGANKGQNLSYFLSRADRVVAIEAVPTFCDDIKRRFAKEISAGRLKVVNAFACDDTIEKNKEVLFYQSVFRPGESTFIRRDQESEWIELTISSISAAKLILSSINKEDKLMYIKIDVEGADGLVINSLKSANLVPDHLSVEIHDRSVVDSVLGWNVFSHVQIVEAGHPNTGVFPRLFLGFSDLITLTSKYKRKLFFSPISSGPFGSELPRKWMPVSRTLDICDWFGLGARDLHFTAIPPQKVVKRTPFSYSVKKYRRISNAKVNELRRRLAKVLKSLLGDNFYTRIRQKVFFFRRLLPSTIRKNILLKKFRKF